MVRKRRDEPHWTRLPFPRTVLQPCEMQEICATPQRELRGPYQLVFWGYDLSNIQLEEMQVGQDICGAAWGGSAMPVAALAGRNLFGPCTHVGNQIKLRLRNAGVCTQEVQTVLLAEFIPDELRNLGCSFHRHVVRGCDACRDRARLRRNHSFSNTHAVAERPSRAAFIEAEESARGLLDSSPMDMGDCDSDDLYGYELDLGYDMLGMPIMPPAASRRLRELARASAPSLPPLGPTCSPAFVQRVRGQSAIAAIERNMRHLTKDQLHGLASKVLSEINLRNEAEGLGRVKFAPDVPPSVAPRDRCGPMLEPPDKCIRINPLPPGGITRHCLNFEVGRCGTCSLCVGGGTLHVREEPPAPAPAPPPPPQVPPAKGPEFDREVERPRDSPPLRACDTLPLTSDHPTATPTREGLRILEANRYAALVSEFEAWESATDEYP